MVCASYSGFEGGDRENCLELPDKSFGIIREYVIY